jgi:AICAR transformylase/IMP cyclohydrolase PurH
MTTTITAPARAELDGATARTAAAVKHGSPAGIQRAAELEEAAHNAYLQRPGADAELQAEAELEAGQ